jgi:hypothetical protein
VVATAPAPTPFVEDERPAEAPVQEREPVTFNQ